MIKKFNPSRGGHAPGIYREAFLDKVEAYRRPSDIVIGMLWNCTDILPGDCCDILEIPAGSTYAQAVRLIKRACPEFLE